MRPPDTARPTLVSPAHAPPRTSFRWVVLGLATFMQVCISLPQQTPAAIGPALTDALGLSRAELGLLTSAIWGGMILGLLPFGMLVDRFGERPMLLAGAAVVTSFLVLASRASSFQPLFWALVPAAVGAAAATPGGTRALTAWFEPRVRATAMGIRQTGVTVAGVVAAVLLPPVAVALGWRAAFLTVAGLSLLGILAFALLYRDPQVERRPARSRIDLAGLVRSPVWLAATAYGWVFMGALGCAVAYLAVSLHEDAGLHPVHAGLVLAVLQVGGIAGRLGWGLLSDLTGSRGLAMTLSAGVAVVACASMAAFGHGGAPIPALGAVAFLLGLSCLGWNALYITLSAEAVPLRSAASAVGAGATITFGGLLAIPPVFGMIADATGSYAWSWLALAVWALLGTLLGLAVRDRRPAGPAAVARSR